MTTAAGRVAAVLERTEGVTWFRAPGRVNLIGDHTDYNGGFVLPLAIDRGCVLAVRESDVVRIRSLDVDGVVEIDAGGGLAGAGAAKGWGALIAAVVDELGVSGRPAVGIDAVLASDVPMGSGLSSSAALEVACAVALADVAGWQPDPLTIAEACRRAEERASGVPCGIMDQLVSMVGRAEHALLIDCGALEWRAVQLPGALQILAVHSGVTRSLADTGYAERRRACEALARRLGVSSLRDATAEQVADEPLGRHVVSENARVLEAVRALESGDLRTLGRLMVESHASLRDDYKVSTPELDVLVELLLEAGAFGARLTGGGFGGAVVVACERGTDAAIEASLSRYAATTGRRPRVYSCDAVDGAGRIEGARPLA